MTKGGCANNANIRLRRTRSAKPDLVRTTLWPLIIVALVLVISGIGCWYTGRSLYFGFASKSWQTVQGQIVQSVDGRWSSSYNGGPDSMYVGTVTYEYEVKGRWLTGNRVSFSPDLRPMLVTPIYPVGGRATIYYDPNVPERSVLIPGGHTSHGWWNIWFCLFPALIALDGCQKLVRLLRVEMSGVGRRTFPIRQPQGMIVRNDDIYADGSVFRLDIPKTRLAYGLYLRFLVFTSGMSLLAWICSEGKISIMTTQIATFIVFVLFVIIHIHVRPRLSVWIEHGEVNLFDVFGNDVKSSGWIWYRASIPIRKINHVLTNEHYMSIEYFDHQARRMAKYTRSSAGLPAGTLPWLAELLVFLKSHPRVATRKSDIPVWKLYGFANSKDFLAAVSKGGGG